MCIFGNSGGGGAKPVMPPVAPPPTTGTVVNEGTTPIAGNDNAIAAARKALASRMGVFGNIKTSPQGDSAYGTSSLSGGFGTFGGSKKN